MGTDGNPSRERNWCQNDRWFLGIKNHNQLREGVKRKIGYSNIKEVLSGSAAIDGRKKQEVNHFL